MPILVTHSALLEILLENGDIQFKGLIATETRSLIANVSESITTFEKHVEDY